MFLAFNELIKEKHRFFLITAVIILVSYLVFFLTALAYGLASSYTRALDDWDASGLILNENANNNISRSLLFSSDYKGILDDSTALLGVGAATVEADENDDVSVFGIETGRQTIITPKLSEGRMVKNDGEILASSELASIGVVNGSTVKLRGVESTYKVVGIVDASSFQAAPVVYVDIEQWRTTTSEISGMTGMRDDTTVSAVVTRDGDKSDYDKGDMRWTTLNDFIFTLPGYQAQVLTFSVMIGFLIGIAAFVLAIFIYILTIQKKSIFGVLKAEGIPNSYIARSVMTQVVLLSVIGLSIGGVLAVATGLALGGKVPFAINPLFFVLITLIFVACAAIGGLASVRSVTKIDPVESIG